MVMVFLYSSRKVTKTGRYQNLASNNILPCLQNKVSLMLNRKFLLTVGDNLHRDPQMDNVQRVRSLEYSTLNRIFSRTPPVQGSRISVEE